MVQAASRQIAESVKAADLMLAADVGGTYARVGLVQTNAAAPAMHRYHKYRCADYPGLGVILKHFLAESGGTTVAHGAIACAAAACLETSGDVSSDGSKGRGVIGGPSRSGRSFFSGPVCGRSRTSKTTDLPCINVTCGLPGSTTGASGGVA